MHVDSNVVEIKTNASARELRPANAEKFTNRVRISSTIGALKIGRPGGQVRTCSKILIMVGVLQEMRSRVSKVRLHGSA